MVRFFVRRVLWMIPTLLGVLAVLFSLNYLCRDDPRGSLMRADFSGVDYAAPAHADDGLAGIFLREYGAYCLGVFTRFDFGISRTANQPVGQMLKERFRPTLVISLLGTALAAAIGIPLGIASATRRGTLLDRVATSTSLIGASVPCFFLALVLILLFVQRLGWLRAWGVRRWQDYILPIVSVGLAPVANIVRMMRSSMLEVIRQDYVRTARSKGLSEANVLCRHCVRNAVIPALTVIGMQVGSIMGTSVIVEAIFSINGIGMTTYNAILACDWPLMMGAITLICMTVSVVNLAVDLAYARIDPRIGETYRR